MIIVEEIPPSLPCPAVAGRFFLRGVAKTVLSNGFQETLFGLSKWRVSRGAARAQFGQERSFNGARLKVCLRITTRSLTQREPYRRFNPQRGTVAKGDHSVSSPNDQRKSQDPRRSNHCRPLGRGASPDRYTVRSKHQPAGIKAFVQVR